jgi:hypothetical protein
MERPPGLLHANYMVFNLAAPSDRKGQLRRIRGRLKNSIKRDVKVIGRMWIGFVWLRIKYPLF